MIVNVCTNIWALLMLLPVSVGLDNNAGDSRAVLVTVTDDVIVLSDDHKPNRVRFFFFVSQLITIAHFD